MTSFGEASGCGRILRREREKALLGAAAWEGGQLSHQPLSLDATSESDNKENCWVEVKG